MESNSGFSIEERLYHLGNYMNGYINCLIRQTEWISDFDKLGVVFIDYDKYELIYYYGFDNYLKKILEMRAEKWANGIIEEKKFIDIVQEREDFIKRLIYGL